jgi:WD40 repeat protein
LIVEAGTSHPVRIWEAPRLPWLTAVSQLTGDVGSFPAFSADGSRAAALDPARRTVAVWPMSSLAVPSAPQSLRPATSPAAGTAISPDGTLLAAAHRDGSVRLHDIRDVTVAPQTVTTVLAPPSKGSPPAIVFAPHGRRLAVLTDATLSIFDLSLPHHPVRTATVNVAADAQGPLLFNPSGNALALADTAESIQVWRVTDTGSLQPPEPSVQTRAEPTSFAFVSDNTLVVNDLTETAPTDSGVSVWTLDTPGGRLARKVPGYHGGKVTVRADPTSGVVAIASPDEIKLWQMTDASLPTLLATLPLRTRQQVLPEVPPFAIAGTVLAISEGTGVTLWDVTDPRLATELTTLSGHRASIISVAATESTGLLATTGEDGTVAIWRTDPAALIPLLCATAGSDITAEQWRSLIGNTDYELPCSPGLTTAPMVAGPAHKDGS